MAGSGAACAPAYALGGSAVSPWARPAARPALPLQRRRRRCRQAAAALAGDPQELLSLAAGSAASLQAMMASLGTPEAAASLDSSVEAFQAALPAPIAAPLAGALGTFAGGERGWLGGAEGTHAYSVCVWWWHWWRQLCGTARVPPSGCRVENLLYTPSSRPYCALASSLCRQTCLALCRCSPRQQVLRGWGPCTTSSWRDPARLSVRGGGAAGGGGGGAAAAAAGGPADGQAVSTPTMACSRTACSGTSGPCALCCCPPQPAAFLPACLPAAAAPPQPPRARLLRRAFPLCLSLCQACWTSTC